MNGRRTLILAVLAATLLAGAAHARQETAPNLILVTAPAPAPPQDGAPATAAPAPPPDSGVAPQGGYPPLQQEDLYLSAMRALADGRPEEATALLMRFLEKEPRHAGAWLDLALSQCELGHAAEAERLFHEIEARFAPPPGIMEVIEARRQKGCTPPPPHHTDHWSLTAGRGYDSNVNQGASSANFISGTGDDAVEWELAPDYLPKPDRYTQATLDYTHAFENHDTLAFAQLQERRHDSVHQQDTTSLLVGLDQSWQWADWHGRGTASASALRLDNQYYQRQAQLQLRVTPPLHLPQDLDWSLTTGLSHVTYPTRTKYDANTLDLGNTFSYNGSRSQVLASFGLQSDQGQNGRLGGNRDGRYANLQYYARLGETVNGELDWSRQLWRGSDVYSPGLIDEVRDQDMQQLHATLTVALRPHHSLVLEWRAVHDKENISLFQYNSRMLQLSWRWDNF